MSEQYVYQYSTIDPCGFLVTTTHLYLGTQASSGYDWIEIGTKQDGSDAGHPYHIFTEYHMWPATYGPGLSSNQPSAVYVDFAITNVTGIEYQFKTQWKASTSSTWITDMTGPQGYYNKGTPLSEIERSGNTDAAAYVIGLKYRPSTGSWLNWPGVACYTGYAAGIQDWDAQPQSSNSYVTTYAPISGGC